MPPLPRPQTGRRSTTGALAFALVIALAVGLLAPAYAQSPADLRRELVDEERRAAQLEERTAQVERELAATRDELATLELELAEVTRRLLAAQEREQRALEDAELARGLAAHARRQQAASEGDLTANADRLGNLARDTYKYGAPHNSVVSLVGSVSMDEGPGQFSDAVEYLNRGIGSWSLLVEESEALLVRVDAAAARAEAEQQRQEDLLRAAEEAREDVAEAHAQAADLVGHASLEQRRQEELVAELEEAYAQAERRIGGLETRIEAEERRLEAERRAREEAQRRAEAEARRQREAAAQRQREADARRRAEADAARRPASQPAAAPRSAPAPNTTIQPVGSGLVTVGGITVASSLGPALQALLDAAAADGIVLGGHGWRSMEAQARLRVANGCRDVYTSPASSCRVPTAIPGSSQHEQGLAIDFTWQGRTICYPRASRNCTGNAAFDWLRANAGTYGLRNLPSEAWHWSTTGR